MVVSSIGLIMTVVVGSLLQIMKVQNRNEAISRLSTSGNAILTEIRRNLINSDGKNIVCSSGSVGFTNVSDNLGTSITCTLNDKIASVSGTTTKKINSDNISIVNCSSFADCSETGKVTINFGIGTSVAGVGVTRNFTTTVTLRNKDL